MAVFFSIYMWAQMGDHSTYATLPSLVPFIVYCFGMKGQQDNINQSNQIKSNIVKPLLKDPATLAFKAIWSKCFVVGYVTSDLRPPAFCGRAKGI